MVYDQSVISKLTTAVRSSASICKSADVFGGFLVESSGLGVELRTLDYENPGSNPGCGVKTLGKFFHSTLLQFTQLNKLVPGYRQWWICVRAAFAH